MLWGQRACYSHRAMITSNLRRSSFVDGLQHLRTGALLRAGLRNTSDTQSEEIRRRIGPLGPRDEASCVALRAMSDIPERAADALVEEYRAAKDLGDTSAAGFYVVRDAVRGVALGYAVYTVVTPKSGNLKKYARVFVCDGDGRKVYAEEYREPRFAR